MMGESLHSYHSIADTVEKINKNGFWITLPLLNVWDKFRNPTEHYIEKFMRKHLSSEEKHRRGKNETMFCMLKSLRGLHREICRDSMVMNWLIFMWYLCRDSMVMNWSIFMWYLRHFKNIEWTLYNAWFYIKCFL